MSKYCGNCGAPHDENARVCGMCGTAFDNVIKVKNNKRINKKIILISAAAIIVVIGVVVGIICACNKQSVDDVAKAIVDAEFGCTSIKVIKNYAEVLPDEYLDYLIEEGEGWLWDNKKEWIEYQFEEYADDTADYYSKYGPNYKYTYRIIDEYKYDEAELFNYSRQYAQYGIIPKEIRDVTIKVRLMGGGNGNEYTLTVTMIKLGSSWYAMDI